jgi:hypothetical protein
MFIEQGGSFPPSSFRSETYIALLKELQMTEEDRCYKHRAPNGAQQVGNLSRFALQASMVFQLNEVHQHIAFAFDGCLLLSRILRDFGFRR